MEKHSFFLKAKWPGGRNSVGTIETDNLITQVSIPPEMNGPGIGTNPDEMLLAAAATCYIITLAAMLERASIVVNELTMESKAIVEVENGVLTYKSIIHRPRVILSMEEEKKKAAILAHKAEKSCMISRALSGNVDIQLEAYISVL